MGNLNSRKENNSAIFLKVFRFSSFRDQVYMKKYEPPVNRPGEKNFLFPMCFWEDYYSCFCDQTFKQIFRTVLT
jgi:hypothetical protein